MFRVERRWGVRTFIVKNGFLDVEKQRLINEQKRAQLQRSIYKFK